MSGHALPRSTPESQAVDPAGIMAFLDRLDSAADIELHSMMIIRNAHVVTEGWWWPFRPEQAHGLYSLSKSFTATAAAFAAAEGLLDFDATVLSYFPELDAEIVDLRSRSILVRHVAAMASGHLDDTSDRAWAADPSNLVRAFLHIPPVREPGSVFAYNQPCTYALAAIVQRQSGESLTEYLRPRLFDPLGIGRVGWRQHPAGWDLGYTGLHATTDAIARLGLLYLQRGVWQGRRLLSEEWVAEATRVQVSSPNEPNPDWRQGYGFQFWAARHGYRGDGAYGQFCIVLPEQDAVVAITAATMNMQGVLDAVWADLLPALTPADHPAVAHSPDSQGLGARLDGLHLTPFRARPAPDSPAEWSDVSFAPAAGRCDAQPSLTAVTLEHVDGGWTLSLVESDETLIAAVGTDGWRVNQGGPDSGEGVPLAVSGGWSDDQEFRAEVIFLETPHRLDVTCSLTASTFEAAWRTTPMPAGRLSELRMPR